MCLKASGDHLSNTVPEEYWRLFRKCPKSIGDLFSNTNRLADILFKCPYNSREQLGAFPTMSLANRKQENPLGLLPAMSPQQAFSLNFLDAQQFN